MADYIYTNEGLVNTDELAHHGIPGMKWGIRRYQNKNGTLTRAGKRRYERELAKAKDEARILRNRQVTANKFKRLEEMKAKNTAKKNMLDGKGEPDIDTNNNGKKAKGKNVRRLSDMSNAEIKAKIERIELENRLKSLTPQKVSAGKKFMESMFEVGKNAATNILADTGKAAVNKWLGLDDSDFKKLEKKSKVAEFKKKIAESEMSQRKNRKEQESDDNAAATAKAKARKEADDKAKKDTYDYASGFYSNTGSKQKKNKVYDADWTEVTTETTALGQRTVAGLLEDPRKKKK